MRRALLFFLFVGCAKAQAPADPNDAGAVVTVRADDEGVFLTFEGPKGASYALPSATIVADASGRAHGGIAAKDLPKTASIEVVVHWENAGPREAKLAVVIPPLPPPVVTVTATSDLGPSTYALDVPCTGDCTGTATFNGGQTFLDVMGTSGCSVALSGETARLDDVPIWDDHGVLQRKSKPLRVTVSSEVEALTLPDALTRDVTLTATLSCPAQPAKDLHFTFGRGAAVTAVWGEYQFVGATGLGVTPWERGDARDRSAAIVFLESDGYMSGLTLETDLVRYYGPPRAVSAVPLAGKLTESPHAKRDACKGAMAPFEVQRCDLEVAVYDAKGKFLTRHRFDAPPVDCATAEALRPVHINWGKEDTVRIVRPGSDAIAAYMNHMVGVQK